MDTITKNDEPLICEWCNCREASVYADGDVWIEGPQSGHWLSADKKSEYIAWRGATHGE